MLNSLDHLQDHLRQARPSLKPGSRRLGVDSWFPYYAGYSPNFVRSALSGMGAQPGWAVLDPWNGAGTTTAVADSLGCDAIGYDINPVATLVAAARLERSANVSHAGGLATQILEIATKNRAQAPSSDPLFAWLSPRLAHRFRSIELAVLDLLGTKDGRRIDPSTTTPPPFASFFLLCLIRTAKTFLQVKHSSNPTWLTSERPGDATRRAFDHKFIATVADCAADAEVADRERVSGTATASAVGLADARCLPVQSASIDAVITSPPYCTRIDYFRATSFELAALGIAPGTERWRLLQTGAMGTNLMRKAEPLSDPLPESVRTLLARVRSHPSKASDTYYYRHFAQYFDDACKSVAEISRVLKPQRVALLVVQSSYYKDIRIPLGELFSDIATSLGCQARVVLRVPVRRVLATINPRARHHTQDREYSEDVVAIQASTGLR